LIGAPENEPEVVREYGTGFVVALEKDRAL
jgi:hypothetical protein